ncbi:BON domain-containing protein [Caulobacter endophyticus]|uniref:BON domain-containing protein n=1 Tax=Caulobacter endophyticus TaxID=2172652 RepID=UPI00240F9C43|nr:BON domain-containing protein [Caulobacter endophyticus]MDG2530665.1 BON domain-containing protein [Caulobacter endophyticus]
MPESRWNDREGRFEIDRDRDFDDERGYGYDASRRHDRYTQDPDWRDRYAAREQRSYGEPRHRSSGRAELRRAISQGGDIGYGSIRSGSDYASGRGYRAPGDYGQVGGFDFGGSTADYGGGGYRGEAPDYGDRAYFDRGRERERNYYTDGPGRGRYDREHWAYARHPRDRHDEDRGWFDRARDEVSAWMGDHDAQRRREHDAAVRADHRGRGPKGYRRSDERIREDVSDRLTDDGWLDASAIEVAVKDGEVTLSGTVHARDDKRRAELLAESVSGVDNVQNNLRLDRGPEAKAGDWTLQGNAPQQGLSGKA